MASFFLNTLPLDGIRPILSYVDLKSLIKLYATFNRKIQALLSSPGAFAYLCIEASGKQTKVAPYRYFVSSIRNVAHLEFEDGVQWSPTTIQLLLTLNPRKLVLGSQLLHSSVEVMLADAAAFPKNEELRRMAQYFLPNAIPNFATLTPRLEDLSMLKDTLSPTSKESAYVNFREFSVPSTLTRLSVPSFIVLEDVPSNLLSLEIRDTDNIPIHVNYIFTKFSSLQDVLIHGNELKSYQSFDIPSTLNSISFAGRYNHCETLITHPALKTSSISSISIKCPQAPLPDSANLDLAPVLPSTLKTLVLELGLRAEGDEVEWPEERSYLRTLPPGLTSLAIDSLLLSTETPSDSKPFPWARLQDRPAMEHLALTSASDTPILDAVGLCSFGKMPPNLKSLFLASAHLKPLSSAEIQTLPTTLTTLQVNSFDISCVDVFASYLPDCHLFIKQPISPWKIPEAVAKSSQHWLPNLDLDKFISFVEDYYRRFKVALTLDICKGTATDRSFSLESNLGFPPASDEQLQSFSSELKSITLPSTNFDPVISVYPEGLTAITAPSCSLIIHKWPFNCLTHLDAPNSRISFRFWPHFTDLQVFKATIVGVEDFHLVPFLTRLLSRRTRVHASLTIVVVITGALLPDDEATGLKDVTWPLIRQNTESILKAVLASPMPALDPSFAEIDEHKIEDDTIGRIVLSLLPDTQEGMTPVSIPMSATSASIRIPRDPWTLAQDWMRNPSTRADGLRMPSQESSFNNISLPNCLVSLRLHDIHLDARHIAFPDTLRFLVISYKDAWLGGDSFISVKFPTQLEALVFWLHSHHSSEKQLKSVPFPSSLKHLTLASTAWLDASIQLPHLKTLQVARVVSWYPLQSFPPLKTLESCIIGSTPDYSTPRETAQMLQHVTLLRKLSLNDAIATTEKRYTDDLKSMAEATLAPSSSNEASKYVFNTQLPAALETVSLAPTSTASDSSSTQSPNAPKARQKAVRRPR